MKHEHQHPHGRHHEMPYKEHSEATHTALSKAERNHRGHDHQGMIADFRRRFWICLILSVPVILISPMLQQILHYSLVLQGSSYIGFVLSSIIFFYGGWPFLKGLFAELKKAAPGMMTLIGVAITVAYAYSSAVVFGLKGMDFFWELVTLIDIMLMGHWLEMKSIQGASRALELLIKMLPSQAHLLINGELKDVEVGQLQPGDTILIRPGEKIPADGLIIEGDSDVDESMLTGESRPVKKEKEQKVIGGSMNGNGSLQVKVEHTGKGSYLNKVIKLVGEAQEAKSKTQLLADKAARWLTYIAIIFGLGTLIAWLIAGQNFAFALERMVTVMVISCPHALGLAVPLVVAISTAVSARNGLLIRDRTAFENARKITTVIFDKTGTLTKGSHEVAKIYSYDPTYSERELLRLAAGVEQNSEHYISRGIVKKAKAEGLTLSAPTGFKYMPGIGLEGYVEGKEIKVVGPNYLKNHGIPAPEQENSEDLSLTVVFIIMNGKLNGSIALADQVREESAQAIKILKKIGIKNLLLTGDNEYVAKKVSEQLKMDGYMANILPHQKQEKVKELQAKGEFVAMTGDGVNDAPALAQADVGIAVGSGTDIAAETADIILVNSNPLDIANLILFGKATYRKMVQNLVYATGYNAVALPLAAGVFYYWGIILSPAIGAVLMSLSTIAVAVNARMLKVKS